MSVKQHSLINCISNPAGLWDRHSVDSFINCSAHLCWAEYILIPVCFGAGNTVMLKNK